MQRQEFHTSLGEETGLQLKNQLSSQLITDIFIHSFALPFPFFSLHTFSSSPFSFKDENIRI